MDLMDFFKPKAKPAGGAAVSTFTRFDTMASVMAEAYGPARAYELRLFLFGYVRALADHKLISEQDVATYQARVNAHILAEVQKHHG